MQLIYARANRLFARADLLCVLAILPFMVLFGCSPRPTTIDPSPERPHEGVTLRVAASDLTGRDLLRQLASSWTARSGAKVQVLESDWDGSADVGLVRTADLTRWANGGSIVEVTPTLKASGNPYIWDDLFDSYSTRLTSWGGRTYGLPVLGEGMVLLYRKDAFDGKGDHPSRPPESWDEIVDMAQALGPGSLPPLASDPDRLAAEFFSAAACYDRRAVGRIETSDLKRTGENFFAFQFNPETGEPRLSAPAFQYVAELFRQMELKKLRSSAADPTAAFLSGQAKLGIVSLDELGRIAPAIGDQLGVAPLPGARFVFDVSGEKKVLEQQTLNRLPYLGWGGRIGVVSKKCAAPEAAWAFLADAGTPERTALELLASPRFGAGPYRISQLEGRARPRWFAYGLSGDETDHLMGALRDNRGSGVQNYRVHLRTPNRKELSESLDRDLRAVFRSPEPADLAAANQHWRAIVEKMPPGEWKAMAARSLGL
jgi:ABC-type glycerol-3-phosphate transport system substrate-binding protein